MTDITTMEELLRDAPSNRGKWGFLCTAAPLKAHRATGAPVNPVVIK